MIHIIVVASSIIKSESADWLWNYAVSLQDYSRVIYIDPANIHRITSSKLYYPSGLWAFCKQIYNFFNQDFIEWNCFGIIPFNRYKKIQFTNMYLNSLVVKYLIKIMRAKMVLVQIGSFNTAEESAFFRNLTPQLLCVDCTDYVDPNNLRKIIRKANIVFTNAVPLTQWCQQFNHRVIQISAGYFFEQTIEWLFKQNRKKNSAGRVLKRILLLGNPSDRWDYDLLEFLVKRLPDYQFICVTSDEYNQTISQDSYRKTKERWKAILNYPNVIHQIAVNQTKYASVKMDADVGIIPYDQKHKFNQYCHPIKIYNYLMLGMPVVSYHIPSVREFEGEFCSFVENKEQFLIELKKMVSVKMPISVREYYCRQASKHTYKLKAQQVISHINNYFSNEK